MSSVTNPHPDQPDAETLVAYLDGELPPEECRRVESRLANDAGYRRQLHDLDQAWEALSALPESRAGDDFARTTMELVTVAAQGELKQDLNLAATTRRRRVWQWSAAALVASLLGFAGAWAVFARNDRILLEDLPVIANVDALSQIQDVEFLRGLAKEVPAQELALDEAKVKDDVQRLMTTGPGHRSTRRTWLDSQPDNQKAQLTAQANRFYRLSKEERDRLRKQYEQIDVATDRMTLQTELVAYNQRLTKLKLAQQQELRELETTDKKIDFIADEVRRDREQSLRRLSDEDTARLRDRIFKLADERRDQFMKEINRRDNGSLRRLENSRNAFAMAVLFREFRNEDARAKFLQEALSDDARARLEQLNPYDRSALLWHWIRNSLRPDYGPGQLEEFFTKELPLADRERLLQLPPEEMQTQLEQAYLAQFGDGADWWFGNRGGDARRRGGPDRPEFPPDGRDMNRREGPPRNFGPDDPDRRRRRPPPFDGPDGPPPGPPSDDTPPTEPPI